MASILKIGPMFSWPNFPEFPDDFYDAKKVEASKFPKRYFYDWTVFTPKGLVEAERYWDLATTQLASLLPARFSRNLAALSGINLGTFNGTFQKAWMRRGYSMYGIELADTASELHAYGCEGHKDSIYDLSTIASGRFDFGVLDRVLCQAPGYNDRVKKKRDLGHMPPMFKSIRRILKDDGAFIGVLYDWYDREAVAELASMGGLTLWPHKAGRLAFCVDLAEPATALPIASEVGTDSEYFVTHKIGSQPVKIFIPTNEMLRVENGEKTLTFAPPERTEAKKNRTKRAVIGERLARNKNQ